ncbi:MAG: endonuclease III [Bacteroidota bacterium]|nr:endonuclease III [Bacteroidota bacterium]
MNSKKRASLFIAYFKENMPDAKTELHYKNVFQLTIAVILSAQCTDKRVNMITPNLFSRFPNPSLMSRASIEDIFELIKTCSYPRNKAKYLYEMAKMLVNDFDSKIPSNLEDLQKLPGVGRKTANVIGSVYFDIPAMAVDTHVFRVSERVGLTKNAKNPLAAEIQLLKIFPEKYLNTAHHWLILHGRYICKSRTPLCKECGIQNLCRYYQSVSS